MTKKEILAMSNSELDRVVKIQGTKFDRKRKVSDNTITKMKYLFACGKSYASIAKDLGLSANLVKYHVNEEYRKTHNHRPGAHDHGDITTNDRAEYKRGLLKANANVIYPMG